MVVRSDGDAPLSGTVFRAYFVTEHIDVLVRSMRSIHTNVCKSYRRRYGDKVKFMRDGKNWPFAAQSAESSSAGRIFEIEKIEPVK